MKREIMAMAATPAGCVAPAPLACTPTSGVKLPPTDVGKQEPVLPLLNSVWAQDLSKYRLLYYIPCLWLATTAIHALDGGHKLD